VLTRDLAAVGITVKLADGEPFDAERHNPVGTEPTSDPESDLRVAATVRLGYLDHGAVVRTPDVIVYRCTEDAHGD
jgi:molecular chaperone GrpE (heat shock protein)